MEAVGTVIFTCAGFSAVAEVITEETSAGTVTETSDLFPVTTGVAFSVVVTVATVPPVAVVVVVTVLGVVDEVLLELLFECLLELLSELLLPDFSVNPFLAFVSAVAALFT